MSVPMTRNLGTALRARFARTLEAEYEQREASYMAGGLDPTGAHRRALEDIKGLGRQALEELGRRGLFPWLDADAVTRAVDEENGDA